MRRPEFVRPEFTRTTTFRWTLASAGAFICATVVIFGFIYWQTAGYLRQQIDVILIADSQAFAAEAPALAAARIAQHLRNDARRVRLDGYFAADGSRVAGNIEAPPQVLPPLGRVGWAQVARLDPSGPAATSEVRLVARRTPDGHLVLAGRDVDDMREVSHIVTRALWLGLIPAVLLALALSALVSRDTVRRIAALRGASHAIMAGRLEQRLPASKRGDDLDALAGIVNTMLDEVERLMLEVKTAGDGIAHDLRTPLTRLRGQLERGQRDLQPGDGRDLLAGALTDLDAVLATMGALLRIGEVEHGARRSGFRPLDLRDVVRDVAELYQPMAEDRGVRLEVDVPATAAGSLAHGDRDLLFELLTNLVDNAIKFSPSGGRVRVSMQPGAQGPAVQVDDDGPGIPQSERDAVLRRFHRGDTSRATAGSGLGLCLVAAIARLHAFPLAIGARPDGAGCRIVVACWRAAELSQLIR